MNQGSEKKAVLLPQGPAEIAMEEDRWSMVANRLVNDIVIDVTLLLSNNKGGKIKMKVTHVFSPKTNPAKRINELGNQGHLSLNTWEGILRTEDVLDELIWKKKWYLFGTIVGNVEREICILVIPEFNMATYAFKEKNSTAAFGPPISPN